MGKHFIDPKSSEILSIFQVFPWMTQIALFLPKLLPALFLKKPWYPCPFEILEETLYKKLNITQNSKYEYYYNRILCLNDICEFTVLGENGHFGKNLTLWRLG
jgi:hypothetical protein